jgi:hypothetical protein
MAQRLLSGQTGWGKTHTMWEGTGYDSVKEWSIIPAPSSKVYLLLKGICAISSYLSIIMTTDRQRDVPCFGLV